MKPAPFDYHAPASTGEALALLAQHGFDAKVLAGGQSLIPTMNFRLAQPAVLVDLNCIPDLAYIRPEADGGLAIGAMTRHSAVEFDPLVAARAPLLRQIAPHISHQQIRNRGTFGGSMAHADPAAHWPTAAVALAAQMRIAGQGGERWVAADDFFAGLYTTSLQPDELLTEIRLPPLPAGSGFSYRQVARQHGAFPLAGAAAVATLDDRGRCQAVRLVFLGAGDRPMLASAAAKLLLGQAPTPALIRAAAEAAAKADIDPTSDIHATADYRRHLVRWLGEQVLGEAVDRAKTRDWGLGIREPGVGIRDSALRGGGANPQSPIPNPPYPSS
jgi:carbon-monoxide dehydrogenase medium subunit